MQRLTITLLCAVFFLSGNTAQQPLTYYLPDIQYNPAIPTPQSVLGYQVGEWHASHDQVLNYVRAIAAVSPRVTLREYARSYENRPLVLLTISSGKNHQRIDEIKKEHIALLDTKRSGKLKLKKMPTVVYQGFSVHGNEASGGNAALLVLYYLAAGQSPEVASLLDEVVILFDPVFNPDGFNRFSSWVNVHKGKNLGTHPANREFNEAWPGGRTNHYWFDLNRDWLPVQHPESVGRIKTFHEWKPDILTDHHEMGSNSTFFFMPGIPSRVHPITPWENQELTGMIGNFHAKALDELGSLYYTKESFDDFYIGKGSTYPDVNGGIGILFEQASSRGHLRKTINGELSFPFTIRNQVTTALSTLTAAQALREKILDYKRRFYQDAKKETEKEGIKGWVLAAPEDDTRLREFVRILQTHDVKVHELAKLVTINNQQFLPEKAIVVPAAQTQYRFIKAAFEERTEFTDSLFYDVSAFSLPLAFNLQHATLGQGTRLKTVLGKTYENKKTKLSPKVAHEGTYAYAFSWTDYAAPRALQLMMEKGLHSRVATRPFKAVTPDGERQFKQGTIVLPVQLQSMEPEQIANLLEEISLLTGVEIHSITTGLTSSGLDLGSGDIKPLEKPEVLLVIGSGVSSYDAGEVWHLLDQRYDMAITLVSTERFAGTNLNDFNTVVMVNGNYGNISKRGVDQLRQWVSRGGKLILMRGAIRWAVGQKLAQVKFRNNKKSSSARRPYDKRSADQGAEVVGGAICEVELDLTHPLAYGYNEVTLPVFRRGTMVMEKAGNAYATPIIYPGDPLLSGYMSKNNKRILRNSAAAIVGRLGSGRVICLADNPNFRAFWYGTNKLFANAVFFGKVISGQACESIPAGKE